MSEISEPKVAERKYFQLGNVFIEQADCLEWLPRQEENFFQLAFADPPFGISAKYAEYDDSANELQMFSFANLWVSQLWKAVAPGGVMILYHPVKMQKFIWYSLNMHDISTHHENTLIAHYNFGQHQDTDFINAHCQAAVIRKPGDRKFNPDDILIESERLKMGDRRVSKSARKGMRVPGNVLPSPRVQGNNRERWNKKHGALVDHPNQLPLSFLKTLISAYTDEGDSVIEPFTGSGGLALACDCMGRDYSGCEIGQLTAQSAAKRVREGYWP